MVDSALFERYPESNYAKILHGNVTEIKKRLEIQKWISLESEIPIPEIMTYMDNWFTKKVA